MKPLIHLQDVKKDYPMGHTTVHALCGVELAMEGGRYYSIVGPSGSGKTTLMHMIGCMDTPTSGEVWLDGQPVHHLDEQGRTAMRARYIGFIFQAFHLNPILTVRENVSIALQFLGAGRREAEVRAEVWLDRVGLSHRLAHYPAELSGGERQRVAIARALVKDPCLVLADEPTGNLDSQTGGEIVALLREVNRRTGATILQVTHDPEIAAISDEIITFKDGRVTGQQASSGRLQR
ncbi:MAG: ABC transporter ATP-binding protein [Anaerolineaceae bacterium]|nr:ABC transporter ATP-binding protein [Anaerolineaceae bacterium]